MLTSEASPFVMEGTTVDGRYFHFKYRYRWATLKISASQPGLVMHDGVSLDPGFQLDAWMTRPEFETVFVDMYHLHDQKYMLQSTLED